MAADAYLLNFRRARREYLASDSSSPQSDLGNIMTSPMATSATVNCKLTGVEVTLVGPALLLDSERGTLNIQLEIAQAQELHQALVKFTGFRCDSREDPILLGGQTKTAASARPIVAELLNQRDCQVKGCALSLEGERLFITKNGDRAYLQLNSAQFRQARAEIGDL